MNNKTILVPLPKSQNSFKRQSNFELLRIVLMLLITANHFAGHTSFSFEDHASLNYLFDLYMRFWGKGCVNAFVLISGYFLCNVKSIKCSKVLKLWAQMLFYSVLLNIFSIIIGKNDFSITTTIFSLFPVVNQAWWFASNYFLLYLLCPFINLIIFNVSKRQFSSLIIILSFFFSLVPTILNIDHLSSNLLWFIYLYFIAAYIKKYDLLRNVKTSLMLFVSIVISLVSFFLEFILNNYITNGLIIDRLRDFYDMQHVLVLLFGITMFVAFKNLEIKHNKIINLISSATFGVYLIHENHSIRDWLWNDLIKGYQYQESKLFIMYSIIIIFLVFLICALIDLVRQNTVERLFYKQLQKFDEKINSKYFSD